MTTANHVSSTRASIAAAAATRADEILVCGEAIDPDVSTMMISAAPPPDDPAAPALAHETVTIAWTSVASAGRYSFSKTSAVQLAIRSPLRDAKVRRVRARP